MTTEEENQYLREQLARRDARIEQQESLLLQQSRLIEQMQAQIADLTQQAKGFHDRLAKNSRKSSLPPSSDRFRRQPKSLRKKSEKKSGGQVGHYTGCFRSLSGAQAFSRIRGYLSTLLKQGLPLLSALQATLCGHLLLPSFA